MVSLCSVINYFVSFSGYFIYIEKAELELMNYQCPSACGSRAAPTEPNRSRNHGHSPNTWHPAAQITIHPSVWTSLRLLLCHRGCAMQKSCLKGKINILKWPLHSEDHILQRGLGNTSMAVTQKKGPVQKSKWNERKLGVIMQKWNNFLIFNI